MIFSEAIKELELQPRHECCDDAIKHLFPPTKDGLVFPKSIKYKVTARPNWYLWTDTDPMYLKFCPWCGMELEK